MFFFMSQSPALRRLAVTKIVDDHQPVGRGRKQKCKMLMGKGYLAGVTAGGAEGGSGDMGKNESDAAQN
jgi:hypothetical protein